MDFLFFSSGRLCLYRNLPISMKLSNLLSQSSSQHYFIIYFLRLYLILEKGEERERNINVWLPLVYPKLGTWPATQQVPWLGIQLATLLFAGRHSIHWATPARALYYIFNISKINGDAPLFIPDIDNLCFLYFREKSC